MRILIALDTETLISDHGSDSGPTALIHQMQRMGHHVIVITGAGGQGPDPETWRWREYAYDRIRLLAASDVADRLAGLARPLTPATSNTLDRMMQATAWEIVHAFIPLDPALAQAVDRLARTSSLPIVLTQTGPLDDGLDSAAREPHQALLSSAEFLVTPPAEAVCVEDLAFEHELLYMQAIRRRA